MSRPNFPEYALIWSTIVIWIQNFQKSSNKNRCNEPSEHLHKLVSNHVTKRRRQNEDTELDEVNASEDPGENFTDNVNGYKYEQGGFYQFLLILSLI